MTAERAVAAVSLIALAALLFDTGCQPGPPVECRAGQTQPRCPWPDDVFRTHYEPVCGVARTVCEGGRRVVAPDGRPACDPASPQAGPTCADGHLSYCHLADCREDSE